MSSYEFAPDVRLLKFGVIYGANASGKSNFVRAYNYIKALLTKVQLTKSDKIEIKPFLGVYRIDRVQVG